MSKKSKKKALQELGVGASQDQFYLNLPYLALIDVDIWKNKNPWNFNISEVLPDFFEKMRAPDFIGSQYFKILGKACLTAAQLHRKKVFWMFESEKKEAEKRELEKKKRETKDLPTLKTPIRRHGEELSKEDLMEQLISALLKDKKRAERQKRKKEKGDMQIRKKRAKRVPLSDVMTVEEFGYEIDKDRMNLQERNQEVLDTALRLIEESEDKEIRFETLLKELAGLSKDPRILMARVLLSILFLIADGFLYAEQEIETKRIWIMDLKHAKKLDYIS
ncbi:MAG: hypothetical protein ACTSVY_13210 [Candidatus Helarchaeota archaeon]